MVHRLTLFERFVSHPRHPWIMLGGALVLLLIPLVVALAQGMLGELFTTNQWRVLLVAPSVILYILAVAPRLERVGSNVLVSLRPVVLVDDETFERLLAEGGNLSPRNELIAFGIGVLVGIVLVAASSTWTASWGGAYWLMTSCLMYGLLAWTVYAALAESRVTRLLLRQPLRIDPLDITPFEAIGRQSLLLALVFVGGITLGLLFSVPNLEVFAELGFWLTNIPIMLVPFVIFFLNMWPMHKVLDNARASRVRVVESHMTRASTAFLGNLESGQAVGTLAQEIMALSVLEQRLKAAQTWPYNTGMLRTLFVSVLVPLLTMVGKFVLDRFTG